MGTALAVEGLSRHVTDIDHTQASAKVDVDPRESDLDAALPFPKLSIVLLVTRTSRWYLDDKKWVEAGWVHYVEWTQNDSEP